MKLRLSCIAFLIACGLAANCKASSYLFTYQDSSGNVVGFTEPALEPSGQTSSFLFDKNSVSSFVFAGNAPAACGAIASLDTGCTSLSNLNPLVYSLFPNGSFSAPGVYNGSNGATVDIVPYSGYLFTYDDSNGNILAFSEPTLQSSGSTSQFLFSTAGVTSFSFSGDTNACGAIGSLSPIGCTELNNWLGITFYGGAFSRVGSFSSGIAFLNGTATVNIVQATATPEPGTAALFPLALMVTGGFCVYRRVSKVCGYFLGREKTSPRGLTVIVARQRRRCFLV